MLTTVHSSSIFFCIVRKVMAGQITEFPNARSSGNGGGEKQVKAPKIKLKSPAGKSLKIEMEPIDGVRLLSAFGTADAGFANLMLTGLIKDILNKGLELGWGVWRFAR